MKSLIFTSLCFLLSIQLSAQDNSNMYCFASITNSNGVTVMSEIYEISKLKNTDLNSFKIINSNSFYKIITSLGHKYAINPKTKNMDNAIVVSNTWEDITVLYDEIHKKSNGKIVIIDKDQYSIQAPSKKELLIRE